VFPSALLFDAILFETIISRKVAKLAKKIIFVLKLGVFAPPDLSFPRKRESRAGGPRQALHESFLPFSAKEQPKIQTYCLRVTVSNRFGSAASIAP
jgi:hypothetical protein